jgi:hypothetical protein
VPEDAGVVAAGREGVDEAEELRLEARMRHRPVEYPLAPPPEVEQARALARTRRGDLPGERLDLGLEGGGHRPNSVPAPGSSRTW